jgi:hypothetical protein
LGFDQGEEDGDPSGGTGESGNGDTCVVVDAHNCCRDGTCVQHGNTCVGARTCFHDVQTQGDDVAFSDTFFQDGNTSCR